MEETKEVKAEVTKAEAAKNPKEKKGVDVKAFKARKLHDINNLQNKRVAKFLAEQVLKLK